MIGTTQGGIRGRCEQECGQQRSVVRRRTMYANSRVSASQGLLTLLFVLAAIGSAIAQGGTGPAGWTDQSYRAGAVTVRFNSSGGTKAWNTPDETYMEGSLTSQTGTATTIKTAGTYTLKFVWNGGSANAPAPTSVILHTTSHASWSGPAAITSGSCDDGLGDPTVSGSGTGSSSGEKWEVMDGSSGTVTKTVTISASVSATGTAATNGPLRLSKGVGGVVITPVLSLVGTTYANGRDNILIGKDCSATLTVSGLPTLQNFVWNVSGDTFKFYEAHGGSSGFARVTEMIPADWTQATPTWHWRSDNTENVWGQADVYVNGVSIGSIIATKPITVWCPYYACGYNIGGVYVWNSPVLGICVQAINVNPPAPPIKSGISWTGQAFPQDLFQLNGTGIWAFVQLIRPGRSYVSDIDGTHSNPNNGLLGLDTSYPYAPDGGVFAADNSNSGIADDNSIYSSGDSPGSGLNDHITSISINEGFKTYMVYRPDYLHGNQWVPLHRILWNWNSSATRPGNSWVIPNMTWYSVGSITVSEDQRCKTHPIWSRVLFATGF